MRSKMMKYRMTHVYGLALLDLEECQHVVGSFLEQGSYLIDSVLALAYCLCL